MAAPLREPLLPRHAPKVAAKDITTTVAAFVCFVLVRSVHPIVIDISKTDGRLAYAKASPCVVNSAVDVFVGNAIALLLGGTQGLRQCWEPTSLKVFSAIAVLYAFGDFLEMVSMSVMAVRGVQRTLAISAVWELAARRATVHLRASGARDALARWGRPFMGRSRLASSLDLALQCLALRGRGPSGTAGASWELEDSVAGAVPARGLAPQREWQEEGWEDRVRALIGCRVMLQDRARRLCSARRLSAAGGARGCFPLVGLGWLSDQGEYDKGLQRFCDRCARGAVSRGREPKPKPETPRAPTRSPRGPSGERGAEGAFAGGSPRRVRRRPAAPRPQALARRERVRPRAAERKLQRRSSAREELLGPLASRRRAACVVMSEDRAGGLLVEERAEAASGPRRSRVRAAGRLDFQQALDQGGTV
ncbi:unnamed protein product [Prorocentrum cordatum]|uniref:Transmembrane protein 147 n=1 Tax=Prorocentrum cordatum TaxID=2364126 RepID=A0ABN9VSQ0_9DINO|nr:unnamed protein product [Polarella glacialis]